MKGKIALIIVIAGIVLIVGYLLYSKTSDNSLIGDSKNERNSYERISQDEAQKIMDEGGDFLIVDVRTPDEYAEGHIKGAINVPNEEIADTEIEALSDKEQLLLVYCRSGNRSKDASSKLAAMGYTNIKEFGGIHTWQGEIVME